MTSGWLYRLLPRVLTASADSATPGQKLVFEAEAELPRHSASSCRSGATVVLGAEGRRCLPREYGVRIPGIDDGDAHEIAAAVTLPVMLRNTLLVVQAVAAADRRLRFPNGSQAKPSRGARLLRSSFTPVLPLERVLAVVAQAEVERELEPMRQVSCDEQARTQVVGSKRFGSPIFCVYWVG